MNAPTPLERYARAVAEVTSEIQPIVKPSVMTVERSTGTARCIQCGKPGELSQPKAQDNVKGETLIGRFCASCDLDKK